MAESEVALKAKEHLLELEAEAYRNLKPGSGKYSYLPRHLAQVEGWAKRLLGEHPEANSDVVLVSVWMHDIGLITGSEEIDHAINSETEVKRFLPTTGASGALLKAVAHCVRAHRCRDVQPDTIEAKILAVSDSASHMTDTVYIEMANRGEKEAALGKLERDLRDVSLFPELRGEVLPLYQGWKDLLTAYPKI
jgi:HD superfamily phosphodiesterase